jgi:hypothetical protein
MVGGASLMSAMVHVLLVKAIPRFKVDGRWSMTEDDADRIEN